MMALRAERSVFDRLGGGGKQHSQSGEVCRYWLAGKCNRNPCRFLHEHKLPQHSQSKGSSQESSAWRNPKGKSGCVNSNLIWRNPNYSKNNAIVGGCGADEKVGVIKKEDEDVLMATESVGDQKAYQPKVCEFWMSGDCLQGDNCKDLHSWSYGSGFSLLAKLEGHTKRITGIALPSGSDKLFSGSKDECIRVWDCQNGQCVNTIAPGSVIGCLISEGPWVFVGLQNAVKAWNFQTQTEYVLHGPNGLVNALITSDDMLFAGVEDGSILAWKSNNFDSNCPEFVGSLKGHNLAVLSLVVGANNRLYSGSKDSTIRVWDFKTMQCVETLIGHTDFVTSVLCWDTCLISGSLDKTLKVWFMNDSGKLEVIYEVKEESGVLDLCGIHDAEAKPILLCAYKDNPVRLYDLPSFVERGRIFAKEVQTIERGCDGLFFTGDATGQLSVWKLLGESAGAGAS